MALQREQFAQQQAQSRYDSYDKQIAAFNQANQQRQFTNQYGAPRGGSPTSVKTNTKGSDTYNQRWFRRPSMSIGQGSGQPNMNIDQSTNV